MEHTTPIPVTPQSPPPRPRKRWGLVLLIPLLLALIVLLVFSLEWRNSLRVQKVIVEGARIVPATELLGAASVPFRSLLASVNMYEVRERLLGQPFIKSAHVNREFPGILRITVEEREPIALLSGGKIRYIDEDGFVLPYVQSPVIFDLPMISNIDGIESVAIKKCVTNPEYFEAINVLRTALAVDSSVYHFISEIDMNHGGDILLVTADVGAQIRLGRDHIGKKLLTLQSFWNTCLKNGDVERLAYVDLRFDDQVIVKWAPASSQHTRQEAL